MYTGKYGKASLMHKPQDYRYSSARNYVSRDYINTEVNTEMCGVKMRG